MKRKINKKIIKNIRIIPILFVIIFCSFLITWGNDRAFDINDNVDNKNNQILKNDIKNYFSLTNFAESSEDYSETYPVGAVFMSTNATNPSTYLGGTWTQINGKTLVGYYANETDFNTLKKTGGAKTIQLVEANLPSHKHIFTPKPTYTEYVETPHTHGVQVASTAQQAGNFNANTGNVVYYSNATIGVPYWTTTCNTTYGGSHTHQLSQWPGNVIASGNENPTAIDIMNPYIVVYMWYRTA